VQTGTDWQWVAFPESTCRDGSRSGLAINFHASSKRVVLYLEGGGSCYDVATCAANPTSIAGQLPSNAGLFDRSNPENPVADWSFVYVPYCSGDVHIGTARDSTIPGVAGLQQFMGRDNLRQFLARLVPTFRDAEQVLLTGASAGGIGALMNYELVQAAFADAPVTVIDDSGPVMSTRFVPGCVNQLRRGYWGLDHTILTACGADCDPSGGNFMVDYARHELRSAAAPQRMHGLIESAADEVIRSYYGIATNNGKNDCQGTLGLTPMDPQTFELGLLDTREQLQGAAPSFGTFYPAGTAHTFIMSPSFYSQTAGAGVRMVDWVRDIVTGRQAAQVGPGAGAGSGTSM